MAKSMALPMGIADGIAKGKTKWLTNGISNGIANSLAMNAFTITPPSNFLHVNWSLCLKMPFGVIPPLHANDSLPQC